MTSLAGTLKASDLGFDNNDEGLTNFRSVAVHAMKSEEVANKLDAQAKELRELRESDKKMKEKCITLQEDMDAHIEDRERVISHKTTQIQQLLQRQVDLQDELAREQEQGQGRYEKLQKETDDEIERLEKKVKELDDALFELRDFKKHKDELDAEMESLRKEREALALAHAQKVAELEAALQEQKERMRREREAEIAQVKQAMLEKMQSKLDLTTRRTIKENSQMRSELRYQALRTEQLLEENKAMLLAQTQAVRDKELSEGMQKQMASKVRMYERLLRKMQITQQQQLETMQLERQHQESIQLHGSTVSDGGMLQLPPHGNKHGSMPNPNTNVGRDVSSTLLGMGGGGDTVTAATAPPTAAAGRAIANAAAGGGGDSLVLGGDAAASQWLPGGGGGQQPESDGNGGMSLSLGNLGNGAGVAEWDRDELLQALGYCTHVIRQRLDSSFGYGGSDGHGNGNGGNNSILAGGNTAAQDMTAAADELDRYLAERAVTQKGVEATLQYGAYQAQRAQNAQQGGNGKPSRPFKAPKPPAPMAMPMRSSGGVGPRRASKHQQVYTDWVKEQDKAGGNVRFPAMTSQTAR